MATLKQFLDRRLAFTLVELLVAVTIFLMIMAMVGSVYTRCVSVSKKSLAILDLHQRANAYTSYFDSDFSAFVAVSAMNIDVSDDNSDETIANIVFMRAAEGGYNRRYPDSATLARTADSQWVCWHWDHKQGRIYRAESRAVGGSWTDKFDLKGALSEGGQPLSRYGIIPTGQRYYKNFIGDAAGIQSSPTNVSAEKVGIFHNHNRNDKHPQKALMISKLDDNSDARVNGWNLGWRMPYFDFIYSAPGIDNKKNIRERYFFGSNGPLANGFAVANQDGRTYNKDFVNMLGDSLGAAGSLKFPQDLKTGTTVSYKHQMKLVGERVEFVTFTPVCRNGSEPVDADVALAGTAINGIALDAREVNANMPEFLHIQFVLHNLTGDFLDNEDLDGDGDFDESLVQACRDQTIKTVTAGSYKEKMDDRRQEFIRLVREQDFFANEFVHVTNLTR